MPYVWAKVRLEERRFIRVLEENLRNAYERLDNQAKILHDQEPVKHASWIYCDLDGTGICSSCRSYGNSQDSYCSNCGAKMDLEDTNEVD